MAKAIVNCPKVVTFGQIRSFKSKQIIEEGEPVWLDIEFEAFLEQYELKLLLDINKMRYPIDFIAVSFAGPEENTPDRVVTFEEIDDVQMQPSVDLPGRGQSNLGAMLSALIHGNIKPTMRVSFSANVPENYQEPRIASSTMGVKTIIFNFMGTK